MARQLVIELVGKADKFTKTLGDAEKSSQSFGDKVEGAGKKMTAFVSVPIIGFLGAATKAAIDDEAAQAHLATTLGNTIGNSKGLVTQVEDYITKAQKASTFTDDELRPAFETFATATKSLEDSQRLTNIAMDVAAAKGIPLEQAATAVAKAFEGQLGAANKLVPGLIDVKDKTLTGEQAVAQLAATFNGQAQAATETTAGKMRNFSRDMGEVSEKIGGALLPAMSKLAGFLTDSLLPAIDKVSGGNGALVLLGVAAAGPVLSNVNKLRWAIVDMNLTLDATAVKAAGALGAVGILIGGIAQVKQDLQGGFFKGLLGSSPISRFLDQNNPFGGRAAGGPVAGGTPYIVGERGPEMFVPQGSGTIVPNGSGGAQVIQLVLDGRIVAEVVRDQLLRKQRTTPLGFAS